MRIGILVIALFVLGNSRPIAAQDTQVFAIDSGWVIGPNDSVSIVAIGSDDLSKSWRISSTGDLTLPLVGRIHAAGMSTEQLEQEVTSKLKQFILNPQVTIYISEYRSVMVVVGGAVAKPGRILAEGPKTLLSVLMLAGGPQAPGPTVTVTRDMRYGIIPLPEARRELNQLHSTIELPLSTVLNASSAAANLIMQPDDVVSVSTQQRLVYILGEVNRPGAIELVTRDSVSVVQVLAAAGGTTKTAAPSKTAILRLNSEGLYKRLGSVDLKGILAGKQEDRALNAGDVLVVPSSSFKMYFQAATLSAATSSILILSRF